jgi:hypothetical protein
MPLLPSAGLLTAVSLRPALRLSADLADKMSGPAVLPLN